MAFPHKSWRRRDFALPSFEPAPLEFTPEADEPSADPASEARGLRRPTSKLLHEVEHDRAVDAAAELRQALLDIRRSLG